MSWTAVNTASSPMLQDASFGKLAEPTPTPSTLCIASRHRTNILAAAETLTKDLPKRRRTSAQLTKKEVKSVPSKVKRKSTPNKSSISVKHRNVSERNSKLSRRISPIKPAEADRALDQLEDLQHASSEHHHVASGSKENNEENQQMIENGGLNLSASCEIIDISSDDSTSVSGTNFDDFDFDFDFSETDLEQRANLEPPYTSTPISLNSPATPKRSFEELESSFANRRAYNITADVKSNGAPFPPFMSPSPLTLLLSLSAETSSQIEQSFTCFRAGELLQLFRKVRTLGLGSRYCFRTEFFATIREVRFADNMGNGQGIVFGDIFFPDRPPFVTTMSKTPYSARDLLVNRDVGGHKSLVKAAVVCDTALGRNCSQAVEKSSIPRGSLHQKPTETTTILEVIEIQHSSWEEVSKARTMIERDVQARGASDRAESEVYPLDHAAIEQLTTDYELSDFEI